MDSIDGFEHDFTYLEACQTTNFELFAKIFNG